MFESDEPLLIDLYGKLAAAQQEIADGAEGEDYLSFAAKLRKSVHGTDAELQFPFSILH